MPRSFAESEILYEQIKSFFRTESQNQLVIEISDKPMKTWKITTVRSFEEMYQLRCDLSSKDAPFAGFFHFDGVYNFYFVDHNMMKSQNIESGQIVIFNDYSKSIFDLKKLIQEIVEFQGS